MLPKRSLTVAEQQTVDLALFGFYIVAVLDDDTYPRNCNVRTHGLPKSFGHQDLQIVVPMNGRFLFEILRTAVELIRDGALLLPGTSSTELIEPGRVRFIAACEAGEPVVRLIFPDPEGRYEDGSWAWQYEQLRLGELVLPEK